MDPVRLVYVLRYFPALTETFIEREIACLARRGRVECVLASGPEPGQAPRAEAAPGVPVRYAGRAFGEWIRWGLPSALAGAARRPGVAWRIARAALADMSAAGPGGARRVGHAALVAAAWAGRLPARGHLHAHFANDPAVAARYLARGTGLRFSFTAHARDLTSDRFLLERNIAEAVAAIGISAENVARLEEAARTAGVALPIHLVHCGLDRDAFDGAPGDGRPTDPQPCAEPPSPGGDHALPDLRNAAGRFRILSVGRLVEKKGHDTLLRAVALLTGEGREVSLTIAGDGPLAAGLRELAENLGVGGRVEFAGGVVPSSVRKRLAGVDAFALACRTASDGDRDGIPVSLLEAMAAGLPVVSTTMPGVREAVPDGAGILVPPGDPEALAGALRGLMDLAPAERAELGRRARRAAQDGFDLERSADALLAAISSAALK